MMNNKWFGPSSLHRQIAFRTGFVVLCMAVLLVMACIGIIGWIYQKADTEQTESVLQKVELLLKNERDTLARSVRDYAVWNDTYDYISKPNRKFETDNFAQLSLSAMKLDFAAILKSKDNITFAAEYDAKFSDNNATHALRSENLKALFNELPDWQEMDEDEAKPSSYLTAVDGRIVIISASRIFDSTQENSHDSLIVFGRYLDGKYLEHLQKIAYSHLYINTQYPENKPAGLFFSDEQTAIKSLPAWKVPQVWLQITNKIEWGTRYFIISIFVTAILVVLLLATWVLQFILNKLVIRRVEEFASLAYRRAHGEHVYWPVAGEDELDFLAKTFNGLMDEIQLAQSNLHTLSVTDALTTLGNRRGMEQEIELMLNACQPGANMSMLLMDLDGFKLINDSLGHAAGDLLLQEVAQRMREVMRKQDQLFRMGGDEFTVLMPNTTAEQAGKTADRLLQQLTESIRFGANSMCISGSIGIAQWDGSANGKELMRRADLAMYAAKNKGKACVCYYENDMSGTASRQMLLEQALRKAIEANIIEPYFQPVMDTTRNKIVAVEMLARWKDNEEFIAPADFIRLSEDLGLIQKLSSQLLRKGLMAMKLFHEHDPDLKLQVNISPLQFSDRNLSSDILGLVQEYGFPAAVLAIELTESAMLLYPEQVEQTMRQFVEAGVGLHLDDFGTGYSSLARLGDLPFDTVKLDRSFIANQSEGNRSLPKVIFDMASSMQMEIIAEGVENQAEFERLQQIGYRHMQGFMLARPMPSEEMIEWLKRE